MPVVVVAVALVLLASACGGGGGQEPSTDEGGEAHCQNVPKAVVKAIRTGLTVEGGGSLRSVQAVKSKDFKSVYFVSADIEGPGLEGTDDVATWATNRLKVGGLIYSVNEVAKEFSDWGDGGETDAQFSMDDHGAEESQVCAVLGLG